jgi:putative ABC transport system substrate-binding protein
MIWLFLFALLYLLPGQAAEGKVAVIYPQLREPYNKIFDRILDGIIDELDGRVVPYKIAPDFSSNISVLDGWIEENNIEAVIGLGRQGYEVTRNLPAPGARVVGALVTTPAEIESDVSVISMTPAPEIVLRNLKRLAPNVKTVSFAYSDKHSGCYVRLIEQAALRMNFRINAIPVENVKQAASFYKEYFANASRSNALWLLQDPVVIDHGPLLSSIMQKAWENDLVVFSNNPAHVARGVLFSHYPANKKLGQQLAILANEKISNPEKSGGILPIRHLMLAVNIRTAQHLGFSYTPRLRREFDLIFPASR